MYKILINRDDINNGLFDIPPPPNHIPKNLPAVAILTPQQALGSLSLGWGEHWVHMPSLTS